MKSENAVNHPNVSKFLEAWYTGLKIKTHTHTHTFVLRTYCIAQGTLLSVMWEPGWEGVWGRMDARMCMAGSLCRPPKIKTTLLGGYIPI